MSEKTKYITLPNNTNHKQLNVNLSKYVCMCRVVFNRDNDGMKKQQKYVQNHRGLQ